MPENVKDMVCDVCGSKEIHYGEVKITYFKALVSQRYVHCADHASEAMRAAANSIIDGLLTK